MSHSYISNIENILNGFPETVQWKNNVTRLNQSNMNTLGSAINSLRNAVSDLDISTERAFVSVDGQIDEINEWKTNQTNAGGDIYLNTQFRNTYRDYLGSISTIYTGTGITYSGSTALQLFSQSAPINISGGGAIKIESVGQTVLKGSSLQFEGAVTVVNGASFTNSVNISGPLTVVGQTTLQNTNTSQLNVSGKSVLANAEITSLKFTSLTDGSTSIGFGDILKKSDLQVGTYDKNNHDSYLQSNYIPTVKFLQQSLDKYAGGVTTEELEEALSNVKITVEQTYISNSEEALSGKAVSQAISQSEGNMNTTIDTKLNNFIGVGTDINQATADNKFFVVIDVVGE